jgi:hypothetical protein
MDEVHAVDPARLVGGGGYDRANNRSIGLSSKANVLLFDTGGTQRTQEVEYDYLRSQGVGKPIVNVEQFGGWTSQFTRGVFPDSVKAEYKRDAESADRRGGLYTFFHNGPWMQVESMRYDLACNGTTTSPGIRWY